MRSFLFLAFKLISRAITFPLAGTQVSLLGLLQLPEYFKNSREFLIPRGSVLLHSVGKELEISSIQWKNVPQSAANTCRSTHWDVKFTCCDDTTSVLAILSQSPTRWKFISQVFLYTTLSINSGSEIIPTILELSPESKIRLCQYARDKRVPSLGSQNVTVQK